MTPRCPDDISLQTLIISQLDLSQDYSTAEIGALVSLSAEMIAAYIRRRYPSAKGERRRQHRLDFRQTVLLIRAICRHGRRLPDRDGLYSQLLQRGISDAQIKHGLSVRYAEAIFEAERRRIMQHIG
jgi:hypothetical protein